MKANILIPVALTTLCTSCSGPAANDTPKDTDTVEQAALNVMYYGDTINADGAMAMADFVTATMGKDSLDAKVDCEIITSCKKKGCWMDVKLADDRAMSVRFKDYGFFVPTEGLEGKRAVIQGHAVREVTSVDDLRHYAEDAGKTPEEIAAITAPDTNWVFTAEGVIIRD